MYGLCSEWHVLKALGRVYWWLFKSAITHRVFLCQVSCGSLILLCDTALTFPPLMFSKMPKWFGIGIDDCIVRIKGIFWGILVFSGFSFFFFNLRTGFTSTYTLSLFFLFRNNLKDHFYWVEVLLKICISLKPALYFTFSEGYLLYWYNSLKYQ